MHENQGANAHPWVIFKLAEQQYAVFSETVSNISMLPEEITPVPDAPEYMRGIVHQRGEVIPLLDLRRLFSMPSLEKEYEDFCAMLEARKKDHVHWVHTLEESADKEEKFLLATDPHQCAFGKWYDQFKTDNQSVNFHMRKIDEPHRKLHETAAEIDECNKNHSDCEREICVKTKLHKAANEYMPQILDLIDQAKEIFRGSYRDMMIVLERNDQNIHQRIGIVVDEIVGVEPINTAYSMQGMNHIRFSKLIDDAASRSVDGSMLLRLNDEEIFRFSELVSVEQ